MTPQQQAAVDDIRSRVEDDEIVDSPGPCHVFEGSAGDDDVLVLYDSDTRIISIDAAGIMSSGYVVPTEPAMTPGWDGGWEPAG
jgi:hypothetical protein